MAPTEAATHNAQMSQLFLFVNNPGHPAKLHPDHFVSHTAEQNSFTQSTSPFQSAEDAEKCLEPWLLLSGGSEETREISRARLRAVPDSTLEQVAQMLNTDRREGLHHDEL